MPIDKKILVINDLHLDFIKILEADGFTIDYKPNISKEEVWDIIAEYHGLIVRSKLYIDEDFIKKAKKLEFIGRAGAGIDNIDENALVKTAIKIYNAPEGNRDAVGEHAIGMLLSVFNNIHKGHHEIINGKWDREGNRGLELGSKTIGIFGYGNTGRSLAKKLQGFGCRVIAYDKYKTEDGDLFAEKVSYEDFLKYSDVVSIHVPLTKETGNFINKDFIDSFEKEIFLINTSRGKVLNLEDLLDGLNNGKVVAACLDVLENEKLNTLTERQRKTLDELIATNKVLLTPHVAGWTYESYRKISEVMAQKIKNHYLL